LDDLYAEQGWEDKFPAGVLEVLKYNDSYYAVPVNMHRQNTLFYNKDLVDEPPMTLDEFFALAEILKADGITPLALSASGGWTLEIVFFSVMAGSAGIEYHNDFFTGAVDLTDAAQAEALAGAVDDYIRVISYTNADAADLGWDQAAELVHTGDAAMYVHGDWAKGYYISQGWTPGSDFDVAASLGSQGEFIYNVDAFALCKDAPNRENAVNFLRVVGSPEAQAAFNKKKGSTPVNADVDISDWDTVAEKTFNDLTEATIIHNVEIHQFSITDDAGDPVGLADKLLELYQGETTRDDLIAWMTENYQDATTQK
jgi:glucose/mannose transport system substrate-binding protein